MPFGLDILLGYVDSSDFIEEILPGSILIIVNQSNDG
jgi:hypothetical protein